MQTHTSEFQKIYKLSSSLIASKELEGLPSSIREMVKDWWRVDASTGKLLTLLEHSNENFGEIIDTMEDILQQFQRFSEYDEEKHTEF